MLWGSCLQGKPLGASPSSACSSLTTSPRLDGLTSQLPNLPMAQPRRGTRGLWENWGSARDGASESGAWGGLARGLQQGCRGSGRERGFCRGKRGLCSSRGGSAAVGLPEGCPRARGSHLLPGGGGQRLLQELPEPRVRGGGRDGAEGQGDGEQGQGALEAARQHLAGGSGAGGGGGRRWRLRCGSAPALGISWLPVPL